MRRTKAGVVAVCAWLAGSALAGPQPIVSDGPVRKGAAAVQSSFLSAYDNVALYQTAGRVTSVFGAPFSTGNTPRASAESFRTTHSTLFGVPAHELVDGTLAADALAARAIMPDPQTGLPKFTLFSYLQQRDGLPVFRADLRLLVRNEPGNPLVLARANVRDLGAFRPSASAAQNPNIAAALTDAMLRFPGMKNFDPPRIVIWAGTGADWVQPRLALEFIGTVADPSSPAYERRLILADAVTGKVLWSEDQICHAADIAGTVTGMATPGKKADICAAESLVPLPYASITGPGGSVTADVNGNFVFPFVGPSASLTSGIKGKWFTVRDAANANADPEALTAPFSPPGPANFVHNQANTSATALSGVNAYLQANVVRDFALRYSPTYPTIGTQLTFPININVSGACNAFYDGSSINFYPAVGSCPSSAFGDIVWHEYGHHLVSVAGSGQGQYGEGAGDMMALLISDEPVEGYGFNGNCNAGVRSGVNSKQYPCNGEIHDCGQLLTGCVWDTRNALAISNPSNYRDILSTLAINSIKLHTGELIDPGITVDFITLDDDNATIADGSPHYAQINQGFTAHNMPAPPLSFFSFVFPQGRPAHVPIAGGNVFTVQAIGGGTTQPKPATGQLFLDIENDGTFVQTDMVQISPNLYQVTLPAAPCGTLMRYYFSVLTYSGTMFSPTGAPASSYYTAISAKSMKTALCDDFESNKGWSASSSGAVTTGAWERAVPSNNSRGDPLADFDGSGKCFVTDNRLGDFDIDGGSVTLTSPRLDCSGAAEAYVSYARWFSNNFGNNPNSDVMTIQASGNDGSSWTTIETVGPVTDAGGGWKHKTFRLGTLIPLTQNVRVRFTASDAGSASTVEAAIDDFKIQLVNCTNCLADYDLNTFVNGDDADAFALDFYLGDCRADIDDNSFVNGDDADAFAEAFLAGC